MRRSRHGRTRFGGRVRRAAIARYITIIILTAIVAGCGVGMPPPTKKTVAPSDIAGAWQYRATGGGARIAFDTNGTFTLILRHEKSGTAWTNSGTWILTGADLKLTPFWTMDIGGAASIDRRESVRWWITDWYSKALAPFGGDSLDPDQYRVLEKAQK